MSRRTQDVLTVYALAGIVAVGLWTASCSENKGVTLPSPGEAVEPAAVAEASATVASPSGDSWESNKVKVTIIGDEWGPGTCHSNGGARTLLIENGKDVDIYSRRAAYTDPGLTCATDKNVSGKPTMEGPQVIAAGEAGTVTYRITMPECGSLQADDCWGPGGIGECAFVIGDSFKSDEICDECIEAQVRRTSKCGDWNECHLHPEDEQCWQEKECVETTEWKCQKPTERKYEEKQKCNCDCVEGGPYGPKDVDGPIWFPEILKGKCPNPSASCREECHQLGEQGTITTYDCKDPERGKRPLCRPVDCPKPEDLCHVSNKGNDRNMMMVITQHGHAHHADRCPADLPESQCNCPNVIADAEACNPGATNFACKDVR